VLEVRTAGSKASINKSGHYQTSDVMGREVHVKDESRFPGKWAFFGFGATAHRNKVPRKRRFIFDVNFTAHHVRRLIVSALVNRGLAPRRANFEHQQGLIGPGAGPEECFVSVGIHKNVVNIEWSIPMALGL